MSSYMHHNYHKIINFVTRHGIFISLFKTLALWGQVMITIINCIWRARTEPTHSRFLIRVSWARDLSCLHSLEWGRWWYSLYRKAQRGVVNCPCHSTGAKIWVLVMWKPFLSPHPFGLEVLCSQVYKLLGGTGAERRKPPAGVTQSLSSLLEFPLV